MAWYEIRVEGRLPARWATLFDGMALTPGPDATTVITGPVADQAALHGLLRTLGDLGLALLAVTGIPSGRSTSGRSTSGRSTSGRSTPPQIDDISRTGD